MPSRSKKWLLFVLRWGIAVAGIWWVLASVSFQDRVRIVDANNQLVAMPVMHSPHEDWAKFEIHDKNAPPEHRRFPLTRDQIWTQPDSPTVKIDRSGAVQSAKVLAIRP